jgi:hypothetical protein
MATLGIRVPTVDPTNGHLPGRFCYVLFPENPTVQEAIAEKVRAELRKARAGNGWHAASVQYLIPADMDLGWSPLDERDMIAAATEQFKAGAYLIVVSNVGAPDYVAVDLSETIKLHWNTTISFVLVKPQPFVDEFDTHVAEMVI